MNESQPSQYPLNRVSTIDALVIAITKSILDGAYSLGEQLREADMVQRFKVSRNSVREAFTILAEQGLLKKEPNRGVFIPVLTNDDISDIYRTRAIFEIEAVEHIAQSGFISAELQNAVILFEALDDERPWSDIIQADVNFHKELVNSLRSSRTSALYEQILAEFRLCSFQARSPDYSLENTKRMHRSIVEAISKRDTEGAVSLVRRHLEESEKEHKAKLKTLSQKG